MLLSQGEGKRMKKIKKKAGVSENALDITMLDRAGLIYFQPTATMLLWINFAFSYY